MVLSSDELIQLGKEAYRRKDYDAAYQKFMDALRMARQPSVDLLDCIAATAEKKDDFQASLKYGRQMIQMEESNARGYLRVGRTLQGHKTEDHRRTAMAIYERGVRRVDRSDPNVRLLQSMLDKVRRNLYPPAACDPFSTLPLEVVEMVLGYLKFYEVVTCLRVCKAWKDFLSSSPRLWTTMDLNHGSTTTQKRIPSQSVKNYIRNSKYALQTAKLGRFQHRPTLVALVKCCKALKALEFAYGSELGGDSIIDAVRNAKALQILTVGSYLDADQVPQILRQRPTLIELNLTHICHLHVTILRDLEVDMLHLTTLTLYSPTGSLLLSEPSQIINRLPNLQTLKLKKVEFNRRADFSGLSKLTCLAFKGCCFRSELVLPLSATNLKLEWCSGRQGTRDLQVSPTLPGLRELFLWHDPWDRCQDILLRLLDPPEPQEDLPNHHAQFEKSGLSDLKSLSIGTNSRSDQHASLLHPRLSKVESLSVRLPQCSDDIVQSITELNTNLGRIQLSDSYVSGVGIKALVTNHPGLKYIELENCAKISPDALLWAESQGVRVSSRIGLVSGQDPKGSGSGRTVRYG